MYHKPGDRIKVVIVGDGGVGKTSLVVRLLTGEFTSTYIKTVFDASTHEFSFNDKLYDLFLIDTGGQEEYTQIRIKSYEDCDIVIVCFSVDDMLSFKNITESWIPEIRQHAPNATLLLVRTKHDKRYYINEKQISRYVDSQTAYDLAFRMKASGYLETSSKSGKNVQQVFGSAIDYFLTDFSSRKENDKSCCIIL